MYVNVQMYVYLYVCCVFVMCVCMCICVYVYVYVCMYVCMYACMYGNKHARMGVCVGLQSCSVSRQACWAHPHYQIKDDLFNKLATLGSSLCLCACLVRRCHYLARCGRRLAAACTTRRYLHMHHSGTAGYLSFGPIENV